MDRHPLYPKWSNSSPRMVIQHLQDVGVNRIGAIRNRIRIFCQRYSVLYNRGRIVQKVIRFIRNRIDDLNRIICLSRISGFCSRILTELFGWTEYWVISFKYQQARLAKKDTSYVCNPRVQNQNKPNPPICLKHLLTMY